MIDQVVGHYRILSELGHGGMGIVYRARDEVLHRDVALKVLARSASIDESSREHLLHEARASSALSHPHICAIHEVGQFNDEFYIVMELVEGRPLSSLIAAGALAVESVMRYGVQIASALAPSHGRWIVHRDLKSANVVVTAEGLVKVLDFRLARRLAREASEGDATQLLGPLETTDQIAGTAPYIAPEVLRGEAGDHRVDIWALGVVLYEAAAGKLPFQGRTRFELTSAILYELPPPIASRIPPALWAII